MTDNRSGGGVHPARWSRRRLLLACCAAAVALLVILSAPHPITPPPANPMQLALRDLVTRQTLVASGEQYDIYSDTALPRPLVQWYQRLIEASLPLAAQRFPGAALPRVQVRFVTDSATRRVFDLERVAAQTLPPATVVVNTYNAPALLHEFIHLYTAAAWPAIYRNHDWDWLAEGIAVHDSLFANQDRIIATCCKFVVNPDTGANWLNTFDGTDRSYRLATGFTAWLLDKYGEGTPSALANAAASGAAMPAALQSVTGQAIPELLKEWHGWLEQLGPTNYFLRHYERHLLLAQKLLPYQDIPAGFRDANMIVHFFSPTTFGINEHIIRWNLRVAPRDGADGFAQWQDNYRAMADTFRGDDILLANRDHPDPLLRAATREALAAHSDP